MTLKTICINISCNQTTMKKITNVLLSIITVILLLGTYFVLIGTLRRSDPISPLETNVIDKCTQTDRVAWKDILVILDETNRVRKENGLVELQLSADLTRLANHKAIDYWKLYEEKTPDHAWDTSDGAASVHRIGRADWKDAYKECSTTFNYDFMSENISRKSLPITRVVDCPLTGPCSTGDGGGWMQSTTGHRETMLTPEFRYIGIYSGHINDGMKFPEAMHIQLFSK